MEVSLTRLPFKGSVKFSTPKRVLGAQEWAVRCIYSRLRGHPRTFG